MRIAVTGATGFLGGEICRRAIGRGWEVMALGRNVTEGTRLVQLGCRFVAAPLSQIWTLSEAFANLDAVIHAAALSSPWGRHGDFVTANVTGTRNVASAARSAAVRRLVAISSTSVYFRFADQYRIREDLPLPPPVNSYAATKAAAEAVALSAGLSTVILRPRGIIGPGDRALLPRLAAAAARGPLPLFRDGAHEVDVTPVATAAEACLDAATPETPAGIYNVSNGEPVSVRWLVENAMAAIGRPVGWRPLPVGPALAAARLLEWASLARPGRPEPIVTRYGLGLLAYGQTLDLSAARSALGLRPAMSIRECLDGIGKEWRDAM